MINTNRISLKIADTIILISSRFPMTSSSKALEPSIKEEIAKHGERNWRLGNFFYKGVRKPDIRITVKVVKELPASPPAKHIFITKHFHDGKENWRLGKQDGTFIYISPVTPKEQYAVLNKDFTKAVVYLLPKARYGKDGKKNFDFTWECTDIIYDFLQIMMIHYLTLRDGLFTHAVGIKDVDAKGLLFLGKSGCGKTTTAKLWHKHTKAGILNDDRIIIRKIKNTFFIYGTPWHGDFSDYLASYVDRAKLERLFFIHHGIRNTAKPVFGRKSFACLFPAIFPPFWDKAWLHRSVGLCLELVNKVPSCRMGFIKDKKVIGFTRQLAKTA